MLWQLCYFPVTELIIEFFQEAMNKEAKQNLAIGGYDKVRTQSSSLFMVKSGLFIFVRITQSKDKQILL